MERRLPSSLTESKSIKKVTKRRSFIPRSSTALYLDSCERRIKYADVLK